MKFDKEGKILTMPSCKEQNKKQLSDKEIQEANKNVLLQIRDLFEDLKVARSDSVKKFIFDNIYKNLGVIEQSYDELLMIKRDVESTANDLSNKLQREIAQHKWEKEMIQQFAEDDKQNIRECHLLDAEDQALVPYFSKLSNEINLSIPSDEMSAYYCYLNGPDIYSFATNVFDLSCGYGKLAIDPKKEAMWKKSQEEAKIELEALKKKLELADKIKKEDEEEDMRNAQTIANEASSFLTVISNDNDNDNDNKQELSTPRTQYDKFSEENGEFIVATKKFLEEEKINGEINDLEAAK